MVKRCFKDSNFLPNKLDLWESGTVNALSNLLGVIMKQKMLSLLTLLLLASLAGGAQAKTTPVVQEVVYSTNLTTDTSYYLSCDACHDLYLDLNKNQLGNHLQLWQPNNSYAQRFILIHSHDNFYEIKKNQHLLNLHIIPDPAQDANLVRIGGEIAGDTGLWKILPAVDDSLYFLISAYKGKALTADPAADPQEMIRAKKFTGEPNQKWRFIPVHK
jgi:hypothetical protein